MKQFFLLLSISILFIACKKIPSRSFIKLDFISIDEDTSAVDQGIEFGYDETYTLEFSYESDYNLEEIYIQLVKTPQAKLDGVDESRVSPVPTKNDKKGSFVYTLNPKEQCAPPTTVGLSVFEFIRIVLINEVGTLEEKTIQFKII